MTSANERENLISLQPEQNQSNVIASMRIHEDLIEQAKLLHARGHIIDADCLWIAALEHSSTTYGIRSAEYASALESFTDRLVTRSCRLRLKSCQNIKQSDRRKSK